MDHRSELRTLVELARTGNARRTAEVLGVSQSTVSEALGRMEREYRTRLFHRDRRGSRPTLAGAVVVGAAQQALDILDNAWREVGLLEGLESGALAIGNHPFLASTHVVPAVGAVVRERGQFHCRLVTGSPSELVAGLREHRLELFVGLVPDEPHHDLVLEVIGTYAPVAFVRADHPMLGGDVQGIDALRVHPIVTAEVPRWYLEGLGAALDLAPGLAEALALDGRSVEVDALADLVHLVTTTDAIGFAPLAAVAAEVAAGALVVMDLPEDQQELLEPLPIVLVVLADRPLPPVARAVLAALRTAERGSGD